MFLIDVFFKARNSFFKEEAVKIIVNLLDSYGKTITSPASSQERKHIVSVLNRHGHVCKTTNLTHWLAMCRKSATYQQKKKQVAKAKLQAFVSELNSLVDDSPTSPNYDTDSSCDDDSDRDDDEGHSSDVSGCSAESHTVRFRCFIARKDLEPDN